jgi:hypothetical protein
MPLASLITQKESDGSWKWLAYDEHGQTMGSQNKCADIGEALENALTWLYPPETAASESTAPQPPRAGVPPRKSRKTGSKVASRGRK